MKLATIGYEGLSVNSFFDILLSHQILTLIDIRQLPLSRKPGFSKGALAKQTAGAGLRYIHLGSLGCPRDIRDAYRDNSDWNQYTQRFLAYLRTQEYEIENLFHIISSEFSCLLCFEANPLHCHRCYVADAVARIAGMKLEVIHLGVTERHVAWLQPSEGKPILQ